MSETLKNLLIVLVVTGIIIFIVNRKKEKFTTVSKLISGIDNMTEKELDNYENKLMDGQDLKILKKFSKENEILERQLNVKYDDEDSDDSSINPIGEEINYAEIDNEFHLEGKMKRKCKKKLNSNVNSEMIIGNNIDENLNDETNNQQIENEDNFRKFLSQGKNTIRDEIEEDDEVVPYIEDELQKFIISEEDDYQHSKSLRQTILNEKKIAESKKYFDQEEMNSDEELDEEQFFVDPKKVLEKEKKINNQVTKSKILKDYLDKYEDEDDISNIVDEEEIKKKKVRKAVSLDPLDIYKDIHFNKERDILEEETLFEEERKPRRKLVRNSIDEDIVNNFREENSELYVEEEDEVPYALFEEERKPRRKLAKNSLDEDIVNNFREENSELYVEEEVPYALIEEERKPRRKLVRNSLDEDIVNNFEEKNSELYVEDETPYTLYKEAPKHKKINKIIEEEKNYIEDEKPFMHDEEFLINDQEDETHYALFNKGPKKIKTKKIVDEELPNIGYKEIEDELDDEMLQRKIYHKKHQGLHHNLEEEHYNHMEEEDGKIEITNDIDYDTYFDENNYNIIPQEDELKMRFTDYDEEQLNENNAVEYEEEDNTNYMPYQEEEQDNDYMAYQEEEQDNDYMPYQEEEQDNDYMPYQEEEQYDYVNEHDTNDDISQQFPSEFTQPVSKQPSGLNRIKNVLQQEMSRQEMKKTNEYEDDEILDKQSKNEMKNRMKYQVKCGAFIDPKYKSRITGCGTKQEMMLHKPNNDKLNALRHRSTEDVPKAIRDVYNEVIPKYDISKDQTCQHVQKGVTMSSKLGKNKPLVDKLYANDKNFNKFSYLKY